VLQFTKIMPTRQQTQEEEEEEEEGEEEETMGGWVGGCAAMKAIERETKTH
jgi:hypothetical protein